MISIYICMIIYEYHVDFNKSTYNWASPFFLEDLGHGTRKCGWKSVIFFRVVPFILSGNTWRIA